MPKVHRQHKPIAPTTAIAVEANIQSASQLSLNITSINMLSTRIIYNYSMLYMGAMAGVDGALNI